MKKIITAALAAALTLSLSCTAFAATVNQDTNPPKVDVTVKTEITPTYTVSIPADTNINFNEVETDFGKIELMAAQINPGKAVQVSVAAGSLANSDDATKVIPYKVMGGGTEFTSAEYSAVGEETALKLRIEQSDWNAAFAGKYAGTVTFTVAYVDAAN